MTGAARVLVGGYAASTALAVLELTEDDRLRLLSTTSDVPDASYLALADDGVTVFATLESGAGRFPAGAIAVLRLERDALRLVGVHDSGGEQPCHLALSPDGRRLLVAHYGCGTVAVHDVGGEVLTLADRRPGAPGGRAHMAGWLDGSRALVTDISLDALRLLELSAPTVAADERMVQLPAGSGPRHFVAAGDHVYVVNEHRSTVTVARFEGEPLRIGEEVSALPNGVADDGTFPAAVRRSADGRSLFVTHRGADVLTRLPVRPDGSLGSVDAWWRTGGAWPQDVQLSRDGQYAVIAHQHSRAVTALRLGRPSAEPVSVSVSLPMAASCVLVIPA